MNGGRSVNSSASIEDWADGSGSIIRKRPSGATSMKRMSASLSLWVSPEANVCTAAETSAGSGVELLNCCEI